MVKIRFPHVNLSQLPVFPFLFGLFPVLYLWSSNRTQQPAYVVVPSLLVSLAGVALIYGVLLLVFWRRPHRAALAAMLVSLYLLSFGHLSNLITGSERASQWLGSLVSDLAGRLPASVVSQVLGVEAGEGAASLSSSLEGGLPAGAVNLFLILVSAVAILLVLAVIAWRRLGNPSLTQALNLVAVGLIILQVVPAGSYYASLAMRNRMVTERQKAARQGAPEAQVGAGMIPLTDHNVPVTGHSAERDVYFILLDNYGRQDVLLERSEFDNSALVAALEERGFVFPQCAQGNYFHTAPMVSSILNMEYLETLGVKESSYSKRGGYQDMAPFIQDSEVLRRFEAYGYHTVTFRGFMGLIDIQHADTYVSYEKDLGYERRLETANFQDLYFKTTIFHPLNERLKVYPDWMMENGPGFLRRLAPSEEYLDPKFTKVYEQNLFAFDALERIPSEIESPKFVYAHLYSSHWPFILRPDGSLRLPFTEKITTEGYVDAVQFTNQRILEAIDAILANSDPDPVIILQGDHANGWEGKVEWSGTDRLKILSAYYLPEGGDALLYDEISPVNNFRLVFKHYFGEDIDLLQDEWRYLDPATKQVRVAEKSCMN